MTPMVAPLLLAACLGAPADCPECAAKPPAKLVTSVFSVMDLVTPIPDFNLRSSPAATGDADSLLPQPTQQKTTREGREVRAEQLVKLITGMVRPYTWEAHGGRGVISFYEIGGALSVTNSPEVVAEVKELLASLRKLQEASVSVQCQLLTVPVGFGREKVFGQHRGDEAEKPVAFLTAAQMSSLIQDVQKLRGATITQTPKATLFSGQTVEMSCGDEQLRTFTTGLDLRTSGDQSVFVPRQRLERLGTVLGLQSTLAADRRSVRLAFDLRQSELDGPVEMVPVRYSVTVKSDRDVMLSPLTITQVAQKAQVPGETKEQLLPVTQLVQKPRIVHRSAKRVVTLPDGGTVAVPLGTRTGNQEVIALLTTRVLIQSEEEVKAVSESPAAKLVAEYHRACAAGRTEEAMRLALQALAADPKCFSNETR